MARGDPCHFPKNPCDNCLSQVTPSFLPACSQLELGELLHDEMFGLFEAMSAIEMMDPKMDAGMICNRSSNTPLSFEEAVATGHLVLSKEELTWADMVGFIWI